MTIRLNVILLRVVHHISMILLRIFGDILCFTSLNGHPHAQEVDGDTNTKGIASIFLCDLLGHELRLRLQVTPIRDAFY